MSGTSRPGTAPPGSSSDDTPAAGSAAVYVQVQDGEDFGRLRRSYRRFVFPMTVGFCAWYLLYVMLSSYAPGFMGTVLFGHVNVAFVFGVLQFVSTFAIAWLYARYAGSRLDPQAEALKAHVERSGGTAAARTTGVAR